jgi:hypothetical protein
MKTLSFKRELVGFSTLWKILPAGLSVMISLCLANGCTDKQPVTGVEPKQIASNPVSQVVEAKPAPAPLLKTQTIEFVNPGDQFVTNTVILRATASSRLPVMFGGMGPCRIKGGTHLTFSATGTVTIVAVQPGNKEWNQAPVVKQSFTVRDAAK